MKQLLLISIVSLSLGCSNSNTQYHLSYVDSLRIDRKAQEMTDSIIDNAKSKALLSRKDVSEKNSPVKILSTKITEDEYGSKSIVVKVKNTTKKTIDGIKIEWMLKDNFGEDASEVYNGGQIQKRLDSGRIATYYFDIYTSLATKGISYVTQVHFINGDDWNLNNIMQKY